MNDEQPAAKPVASPVVKKKVVAKKTTAAPKKSKVPPEPKSGPAPKKKQQPQIQKVSERNLKYAAFKRPTSTQDESEKEDEDDDDSEEYFPKKNGGSKPVSQNLKKKLQQFSHCSTYFFPHFSLPKKEKKEQLLDQRSSQPEPKKSMELQFHFVKYDITKSLLNF